MQVQNDLQGTGIQYHLNQRTVSVQIYSCQYIYSVNVYHEVFFHIQFAM